MKIAILGFGTVGSGVFDMAENADGIECRYVLVRKGKEDKPFKVADIETIINDRSIECVIEAMGGVELAYTYAVNSIKSGKHFVTSNKALVAEKGDELAKIAEQTGVSFMFSAACGGAIPFLHNLSLSAKTDKILSLGGILNGTTNFILDLMQSGAVTYEKALKLAKDRGYAEADPSADVTGLDSLRKIMLGCAVAYGKLPYKGMNNEGIESFTHFDADYLKENGKTLRLIATAHQNGDSVSAYVEPTAFGASSIEACVCENFNLAGYTGQNCGKISLMGQGAGKYPTASAILRDITELSGGKSIMMSPDTIKVEADNTHCINDYILRCDKSLELPFDIGCIDTYRDYKYCYISGIPVPDMHKEVCTLRQKGHNIFFAHID